MGGPTASWRRPVGRRTAFERMGLARPEVRVLGEEPRDGNAFEVESTITPPPISGSVESEMIDEITRLITFFQTSGPEPSTQP
jgi:hypothetical protein